VSENASQQTMTMAAALAVGCGCTCSSRCAKWLVLCILVRVLFAVVELLFECLGLLLVGKRETS